MILPLVVAEQELETDVDESIQIRCLVCKFTDSLEHPGLKHESDFCFRRVLDHFIDEGTTSVDLVNCFSDVQQSTRSKSAVNFLTNPGSDK